MVKRNRVQIRSVSCSCLLIALLWGIVGHGGGWGYSAHSVEAIRFCADADILLGGLGLFGGRGEYTAKIKVSHYIDNEIRFCSVAFYSHFFWCYCNVSLKTRSSHSCAAVWARSWWRRPWNWWWSAGWDGCIGLWLCCQVNLTITNIFWNLMNVKLIFAHILFL